METLIDSLDEEEQRQIDPQLFTCCPSCNHRFKIVDPTQLVMGDWGLWKDLTFYKGTRIRITKQQSHLLFEIAKSNVPLKTVTIGYRICSAESEDFQNIVAVQVSRLKKTLVDLNIPYPLVSARRTGYWWNRTI